MTSAIKGGLYGLLAGGLLALTLGLWGMWQQSMRHRAEASLNLVRAQYQEAVAAGERASRKATELFRAAEQAHQFRVMEALHELQRVRAANAAELDRERRAADLRVQQLAAYAAGAASGAGGAQDSIAACQGRAAALGDVLGEALRAHGECTAAAEDLAGDVRALQDGWPR